MLSCSNYVSIRMSVSSRPQIRVEDLSVGLLNMPFHNIKKALPFRPQNVCKEKIVEMNKNGSERYRIPFQVLEKTKAVYESSRQCYGRAMLMI